MSSERQVSSHNIPKREYEGVSIKTCKENFNFEDFKSSLCSDENYKKKLYLFKIENSETNQATLYAYDWFERKKSLEQLIQTTDSEEIGRVEKEMARIGDFITPESEERIEQIISLYGYRHNYASRMHKVKL